MTSEGLFMRDTAWCDNLHAPKLRSVSPRNGLTAPSQRARKISLYNHIQRNRYRNKMYHKIIDNDNDKNTSSSTNLAWIEYMGLKNAAYLFKGIHW